MKRLFLFVALFVGLFGLLGKAEARLVDFYPEVLGRKMPSLKERALDCAEVGVWGYTGKAQQNIDCEKRLREVYGFNDALEDVLGFSVVTKYRTTLSSSMTATQTTVPVASIRTTDDHTLVMSDLGPAVYLTVEPGGVREEITKCTAITNSQWSSCTRGLAFFGTSEAEVAANRKAHNAGSIVVMSNVHYVYEQFIDKDADREYASGTKWFTSRELIFGDGVTTTKKKLYFCDSNATSSCSYIFSTNSTTADGQQELGFSTDGTTATEFVLNSGGTVFSTGNGLQLVSGVMSLRLAATSTSALGFSGNQLIVTTTFPNGLIVNADGLALSTSTPFSFSASSSFTGNAYNGLYINNVTSTNATTTQLGATVVSSTQIYVNGLTLGGTTTTRSNAHYHSTSSVTFIQVYTTGEATGAKVLYHGLGVVPSRVEAKARGITSDGTNANSAWSEGFTTSTIRSDNIVMSGALNEAGLPAAASYTTTTERIVQLRDDANASDFDALITAWDNQTITLTIDTNTAGTGSGNRLLFITVFK